MGTRSTQLFTSSGVGNEFEAMGEGLVWLIGAVVCLLAGPFFKLFAGVGNKWPHNTLQYH